MKKLRVLCLAHETLVPPDHVPASQNFHHEPWRTEYYVLSTLKKLGHEAMVLGVRSDLELIRNTVAEFKPDIIFNLLEEFHDCFATYYEKILFEIRSCIVQFRRASNPLEELLALILVSLS
jgi:D-alanine-D-alanine ligase